ncbi:hypothetical protein BU17DRAFT_69887 [Hysterangium stoloniferum]|nr:hypothetical protein BU17DRAFT_69887 [Hysterangium stoloniferum]
MDTPIRPLQNSVGELQNSGDVKVDEGQDQSHGAVKSPKLVLLPAFSATLPPNSHLPTPHRLTVKLQLGVSRAFAIPSHIYAADITSRKLKSTICLRIRASFSTSHNPSFTYAREQQFPSQVATPSPEVSRILALHGSIHDAPSDSETIFMTPQVDRQKQRSPSYQHAGPIIDSPYQSSPERRRDVDSSSERQHSSPQPSQVYDPDDPFIDHQPRHCVSHTTIGGSVRKGIPAKPDSDIARLIRSPGAFSDTGERAGVAEENEDEDADADGEEDDGEGEEVDVENEDVVMQPVTVVPSSLTPVPSTPPPRSRLLFDSPLTPYNDSPSSPYKIQPPQDTPITPPPYRPSSHIVQDSGSSPPVLTHASASPTHFPPVEDVASTPPPLLENLPPSTPPPPVSTPTPRPITPQPLRTTRTPSPQTGGELTRIREQQTSLEHARIAASEPRRPEYLIRAEREHEEEEDVSLNKSGPKAKAIISPNKRTREVKTKLSRVKRARVDEVNSEDAVPEKEGSKAKESLGVTATPVRGRRLKLYQPVPLPVLSQTPSVLGEPSAVPAAGAAGAHNGEDTSEEPKTPPLLYPPAYSLAIRAIDWRTPNKEPQQQQQQHMEDGRITARRLDAFRATRPSGRGRKLKGIELAGRGRVIIDVGKPDIGGLFEALQVVNMPNLEEEVDDESPHEDGTQWPDKEYPWSESERQRDELEETERKRRLARIERFLERESESDEDDNDCIAGLSLGYDSSSPPPRPRGRGKTIALNPTPRKGKAKSKSKVPSRMLFGAATADARHVLMSKKHVRAVAERLRQRRLAEEEEGVVMCICQNGDDGRAMVRCDACRTWYHLVCMDIHDPDELGEEWFCWKCLPDADNAPVEPVVREPTFVPSRLDSPPRAGVGDQPFYQYLEPSPMLASPVAASRTAGPSTPYIPHRQGYDEYEHAPFDPTSTPSRGLKFPGPAPVTPRRQAPFWGTPRTPLMNTSPAAWGSDESPVRRRPPPPPPPFMPYTLPRTPLAARGRPFPGAEESPTRPFYRNLKEAGGDDLFAAMRQGKSPQRHD